MKKYLLALDQGTSSTRAILFDFKGNIIDSAQVPLNLSYPSDGWVEVDAKQILDSAKLVLDQIITRYKGEIASIGITNQRETTIIFDKLGNPVYNALVWQSRQSSDICLSLKQHEETIKAKTGLPLDPYFSASKIRWILDHITDGQKRAESGELLFGTVETFLVYHLLNIHVSDVSNASRTLLFNISSLDWDEELLKVFNIPSTILPKLVGNTKILGTYKNIPVGSLIGDQQAALFGQGCFEKGCLKNTYGTGGFLLLNTGEQIVQTKGLLTTVGFQINEVTHYAIEGSTFVAGSLLKWLRDQLNLFSDVTTVSNMANSVLDNNGVYLIPAFVGMGAPLWEPKMRASIMGINFATTKAHLVRAGLEAIAYQTHLLITTLLEETKIEISSLKVDGGVSNCDFLMQFQADLLGLPLGIPKISESTAFGAALLAGLSVGVYQSLAQIKQIIVDQKQFNPSNNARQKEYKNWLKALEANRRYSNE